MVSFKTVAAAGMVVIAVVAFVAGLYASPLVFPPKAPEDSIWTRVDETKKIVVGTEPGWPPYEFRNVTTNEIVGFEIDLIKMIASDLGLTAELRDMAFDTIIPSVQAKDIDLGVSGFSVTSGRLETIDFTMPHSITEGQVVMLQTRANALGITQLQSLKNLTDYGLKCGTQVGTTQQDELTEAAPGALQTYEDFPLALTDMKLGRIDAVYAETPITSNWILEAEQKGETPIVVVFSRPYFPVAFVANKDADIFVAKINGALAEIIASGRLDELRQKWKT